MRLINVYTLELREFTGEASSGKIPQYAILSHTWDEEEVTFRDLSEDGGARARLKTAAYDKITGCCAQAKADGLEWAWVDTCCIDKSSSAELSEAINSMFDWYADSRVCYAYLSDTTREDMEAFKGLAPSSGLTETISQIISRERARDKTRWFTRGWTLQELLAPGEVVFFDRVWVELGSKRELAKTLAWITGISAEALTDTSRNWDKYSVAQRFSWAAQRETTRKEDEAYSLLGLFGVNMPLLYGEGHKSFMRLQEEIIRRSNDQSIYAWACPQFKHDAITTSGLLAPSPDFFRRSSSVSIGVNESADDRDGQIAQSRSNLGSLAPLALLHKNMQTWMEEYMNPFQIIRDVAVLRQPLLGPLLGCYCERKRSQEGLDMLYVSAVRFGNDNDYRVSPNVPTRSIEPQSSRARAVESDWGVVVVPEEARRLGRQHKNNSSNETGVRRSKADEHARDASHGSLDSLPTGLESSLQEDDNTLLDEIFANFDLDTESADTPADNARRWLYTRKDTYLVPLLCSIDGNVLCLRMSWADSEREVHHDNAKRGLPHRRILVREHGPSLLCLDPSLLGMLRPENTLYACAHRQQDYNLETLLLVKADQGIERILALRDWPEIRIGALLNAGYSAFRIDDAVSRFDQSLFGLWPYANGRFAYTNQQEYPKWARLYRQSRPIINFVHASNFEKLQSKPGRIVAKAERTPDNFVPGSLPPISFSILLDLDHTAIAIHKIGEEPLDYPEGVPRSNPFDCMPGVIATRAFDPQSSRRFELSGPNGQQLIVRSRGTGDNLYLSVSIEAEGDNER